MRSRSPRRSPLVQLLAATADDLLRLSPTKGVTTADLILAGRAKGYLKGTETHRELSGIGHVFKAVGAKNSGKKRPSHIPEQKGVAQTVWVR